MSSSKMGNLQHCIYYPAQRAANIILCIAKHSDFNDSTHTADAVSQMQEIKAVGNGTDETHQTHGQKSFGIKNTLSQSR